MAKIIRAIDRLCVVAAGLAAVLFFVIGLIVTYEVVMRYVFLNPTRWVEESARVLQVYGVFLACAWLVGRREHIRIPLFQVCWGPVRNYGWLVCRCWWWRQCLGQELGIRVR